MSISRYALMRLGIDAPNIDRQLGSTVKVSFAPLRHHFVLAAAKRPSALRFCKGAMNLARSYDLTPIAAGVDSEAARQLLIALGCQQGIGEHFARLELKQLLLKKMVSA